MKKGTIALLLLMVVATVLGLRCENNPAAEAQAGGKASVLQSADFSIDPYALVLDDYVNDAGMIDYAGLKKERSDLDTFVSGTAALDSEKYDQWDSDGKIAFWINAYNALTLVAIIDHYPIEAGFLRSLAYPENSIRQIPGVWKELEWTVMGRSYTLDAIEHDVLRSNFDEPRIHASLVCAAMGCPPLRDEPYRVDDLDAQLDDQMRRFLSNPEKFRIDREKDTVFLSPIFEWFGKDFVGAYQSEGFPNHGSVESAVLNAVSQYVSSEDREYLLQETYSVEYLDYDWTLNEQ